MRALVLVTAVAGCGRLHFDPLADVSMDAEPARTFAYAVNRTSGTITVASVDPATGALQETADSPFTPPVPAYWATVSSDGHTLYVGTDTPGAALALHIDATTGALSLLNMVVVGNNAQMVALHPTLPVIYVMDYADDRIFVYALAADGSFGSTLGSQAPGSNPRWLTVHPSGSWLYAVSSDGPVYLLDIATDGNIAVRPEVWLSNDPSPNELHILPDGRHGFVAPVLSGGIPGCTIDGATGVLTTTPGSKFGSDANTTFEIAFSDDYRYLLAANDGDSTVSGYSVDAQTGSLTPVPGSPITVSNYSFAVASVPGTSFAYATASKTTLVLLRIDVNGLAVVDPGVSLASFDDPQRLVFVRL